MLLTLSLTALVGFSSRLTVTRASSSTDTYFPFVQSPLPDPIGVELTPFADGFVLPTGIVHAGDDRLFVLEKRGIIKIVQPDGTVMPEPFADLTSMVWYNDENPFVERGLLAMAFHPNYAENGEIYIYFIQSQTGDSILARFLVSPTDPNKLQVNSREILIRVDQPDLFHNGGQLMFGPDGYLYWSLGDGDDASIFDSPPNPNYAQDLSNLLGSIVRIDVDQSGGRQPNCKGSNVDATYTIPLDNPFATDPGAADTCGEIYAYGLRNPWRFTIDPVRGNVYIADVGYLTWEELNVSHYLALNGKNFGWYCYEGNMPLLDVDCPDPNTLTGPTYQYNHNDEYASITGGEIFRSSSYPFADGLYLFANFGQSPAIYGIDHDATGRFNPIFKQPIEPWITSFGRNASGDIFAVDINFETNPLGTDSTLYEVVPIPES